MPAGRKKKIIDPKVDFTKEELKLLVDNTVKYLDLSYAELERNLGIPNKTFTLCLRENATRLVPSKHVQTFIDFIKNNDLVDHVVPKSTPKEEPVVEQNLDPIFGALSKEEIQNKIFWIEEVKKAVGVAKGN